MAVSFYEGRKNGVIKNEKGLTLLEIIAAALILSFIVLAFADISGYSRLSFAKSDKKNVALRLAEQKLKDIRNTIESTNPAINTQNMVTTPFPSNTDYSYTISDTPLTETPTYTNQTTTANRVSLQAVVLMDSGTTNPGPPPTTIYVPRLITVTVSWEDNP
jgi:Tfp pilus assembly protein PilV